MTSEALAPYDAVLLLSFGGPEAPDEVMPFLRRVTAGRGIPDDRLQDVAHHYELFGGRSPINDQNRALIAALEAELKEREIEVPVLWGNRNSPPYLPDALRDAAARGLHRIVVVTTLRRQYQPSRSPERVSLQPTAPPVTGRMARGAILFWPIP